MILVSGATGFIGRELVLALLREFPKKTVVGLFYPPEQRKVFSKKIPRLKLIAADLTRQRDLRKIPSGFSHLFHLASFVPKTEADYFSSENFKVNCTGTQNLMKVCAKNKELKQIILSSSISVYGKRKGVLRETQRCIPENDYGKSKLAGENIVRKFCEQKKIEGTILRYASVYGIDQHPGTVLPIFIERCLKEQNLELYGRGQRYQDFVCLGDVIKANVQAMRMGCGGIYNIGSGRATTMRKLAMIVKKYFGTARTKIVLSDKKERKSSARFDIGKAKKKLRYRPEYDIEKRLRLYASNYGQRARREKS